MSRPISLFSGYSQRENRTTNYCLLVLKMLYEENPNFLAEALSKLVGEELGEKIGVKFQQQEKKSASVPDGLISQVAFTIYIETKNLDWFYDSQLERHLEALNQETTGFKVLIALSAFEVDEGDRFKKIRGLCADKYKNSIAFKTVSFDEFLDAVTISGQPKNLQDALRDFRVYLDEQDLLPSWQDQIDVVNCAGLPVDILEENVYMCPDTGGAYNHARCKFFGMYQKKRVGKVALIEAVVDVEDDQNASLKWSNVATPETEIIKRARAKVQRLRQLRSREYPLRVFLLGPLYDTDFRKDTPRGMFGSKQYFDVGELDPTDAQDLAAKLRGKTWSQVQAQEL
ncbi:MAG: hypothetical protein U0793_31515 [Gemmataceae bacterium]